MELVVTARAYVGGARIRAQLEYAFESGLHWDPVEKCFWLTTSQHVQRMRALEAVVTERGN